MKTKMKKSILVILSLLLIATLAAQTTKDVAKSPWSFSVTTDAAYYPKTNYVSGNNHFAPITGPYSGLEARVTGNAAYTIKIPFGDGPLVSGNTLVLNGAFELSPIYAVPQFSVSFTPIAFLNFAAGGKIGTGWDFSPMGMIGAGIYNSSTQKYDAISAFSMFYYNCWASGTFQFDVAALAPGDWHHIVTVASYKVFYEGLNGNGCTDGKMWYWGAVGERANGWQQEATFLLAYQMPIMLKTVGVMTYLTGHYNDSDYSSRLYPGWDGDFLETNICPIAQIAFTKKDTLTVMFHIRDRRSFKEEHTEATEEPLLTCCGNEWFFNRIALSFTHSF